MTNHKQAKTPDDRCNICDLPTYQHHPDGCGSHDFKTTK